MTLFQLALANLRNAPLTNALNIGLLTVGTATMVTLLLISQQISTTLSRDAQGIDLVLGAKGSPVQLIMSAVYHADIPTGNIPLAEAQRWADDRRIAQAVPLAMGDSAKGFRIIGTTADYIALYGGSFAAGQLWGKPLQAVLGATAAKQSGLRLGDRFASAHGMGGHGDIHDQALYQVVGILNPSATVLDRLILTSLDSVWAVHSEPHSAAHPNTQNHTDDHIAEAHKAHGAEPANVSTASGDEHEEHEEHEHEHEQLDQASAAAAADTEGHHYNAHTQEITAMLLSYASPISAASLPRQINAASNLQAAAPAFELARLLQIVGLGLDGLQAFAFILMAAAVLSVFVALYSALQARRAELAMMRCLGATPGELMTSLLLEGLLLGLVGSLLGVALGHGLVELLGHAAADARNIQLSGKLWLMSEVWLVLGLLGVYTLASLLPAWQAYRTDVARALAHYR